MKVSRKKFIKIAAAVGAAIAIGSRSPKLPPSRLPWRKAAGGGMKPCARFYGTGCGIMVATKDDKVVAVKGDPAAPVNRGLNCIKSYFNAKII